MKVLHDFFVLVLRIFIAIGDVVLLFGNVPKLLNRKRKKVNVLTKFKDIRISFPFSMRIARKRERPIVIFPLPFFLKFKYFAIGALFSLLFIFVPLLLIIFLQDLPSPKTLVLGQILQTTKIYDRNGTLLYQVYADQNRTVIPLAAVPKHLQQATIAIEDKDFYKHPGFDISAIIRSVIKNLSGDDLQGGSTITQQLIKSALLTPETSLTRKVKEVILAFWTERLYSKNTILEMYFNHVSYGGTAWGIAVAVQTYFGKSPSELTLSESAFLAGIPKAPSIYSPFGTTPSLWKKRQIDVLTRMVNLGYITHEEAKNAQAAELTFQTPRLPLHAPHFVMYVRDLLTKEYGTAFVEKGGLTVITSLDLNLHEKAQKIVSNEVENNAFLHLTNGAALVTDPRNGDILAMVGSHDFSDPKDGNVNVARSLRQPGSSIKVVTYSAALSQGFTAATILDDSSITFPSPGGPSYTPVNYDGKFHGRVPLRLALGNSFNIPAVKTLNQIGIPTMVEQGRKMGIRSWNNPEDYGLSITLGGAEVTMVDMATVYGVLANQGLRVDLNPFLKITDSKGNVLEEKNQQEISGKRVLDEGIAFIISDILSDNTARAWAFGTNSTLVIPGHTVSVKTGTSDNKRDNWAIGYTKDRLTAVWVGNNDNSPMSQALASGITGAAPIWNKIMTLLLTGKPYSKPPIPANIVAKPCLGRFEYFIKGTENSVSCRPLPPSPSVSPSPATSN